MLWIVNFSFTASLSEFTCCSVQAFLEQNIVIAILQTVKDIISVLEGEEILSVLSFLWYFFLFHSVRFFAHCVAKVSSPCKCRILLFTSLAFFLMCTAVQVSEGSSLAQLLSLLTHYSQDIECLSMLWQPGAPALH